MKYRNKICFLPLGWPTWGDSKKHTRFACKTSMGLFSWAARPIIWMFSGENLFIKFTNNVRVEYILSMLMLCKITNVLSLIQRSWSTANAKQREKLLELIRRLAEDDKDGVMADKGRFQHFSRWKWESKIYINYPIHRKENYFILFLVLTLFWNLAHSSDVSIDIMDQALSAHVKILDYRYYEINSSRQDIIYIEVVFG